MPIATIALLITALFTTQGAIATPKKISVESGRTIVPLLELYTSEGCSSCPPADKWLSKLTKDEAYADDVLALAFHVDYWDYLGWKDPYGKALHTQRQRTLASNNRSTTIYTPEFFLSGEELRGTRKILGKLKDYRQQESDWKISATAEPKDKHSVLVNITTTSHKDSPANLYIAHFENGIQREIARGENRGRSLHHDYVVRDWLGPYTVSAKAEPAFNTTISLAQDAELSNSGLAVILMDEQHQTLQTLTLPLNTLDSE